MKQPPTMMLVVKPAKPEKKMAGRPYLALDEITHDIAQALNRAGLLRIEPGENGPAQAIQRADAAIRAQLDHTIRANVLSAYGQPHEDPKP